MTRHSDFIRNGMATLSGIGMIAATYVYFLIFAEFAFLEIVQQHLYHPWEFKTVMAALGLGGIAGSAVAGFGFRESCRTCWLLAGFGGCAIFGAASDWSVTFVSLCAVAGGIGFSMGVLTVSLVASLPILLGYRMLGLKAGIGTGLAYFLCNLPVVFESSPLGQRNIAIVAAFVGLVLSYKWTTANYNNDETSKPSIPARAFAWLVLLFLVLVWLDSAAFYIIQHQTDLKALTWQNESLLYANALLHFFVAAIAGWWVDRKGLVPCLIAAFLFLIGAVFMLQFVEALNRYAHLSYVAGVSLYSTPLVITACLVVMGKPPRRIAARAAWLYAIAGWAGSGLGIGMAQRLNRIPLSFVVVCLLVFALGLVLVSRHKAPA